MLADRVLTFLVVVALVVQVLCFVLHVWQAQHPSERASAPAAQGARIVEHWTGLSEAEEALIASLESEEQKQEAREILEARARGPGGDAEAIPPPNTAGRPRRGDAVGRETGEMHGVPRPPSRSQPKLPSMYGPTSPRIAGLEQCGEFRARTSVFRRLAVAGLFNSGTNVLHHLMRRNCVMPMACPETVGPKKQKEMMARKECIGYPFQVPWGKHNPESFRRSDHVVPQLSHFNRSEILPMVVIKDPLTWMRSMCRVPYAAKFAHSKCCPSPLDPTKAARGDGSVKVNWRKFHTTTHTSLLDLWNTWYSDYWRSPQPRLLVRYEDVLFQSRAVVKALCACAGGRFKTDFDPIIDPAKHGAGHGGTGTSRADALLRYSSEALRYQHLSSHDLHYYNATADPALVNAFYYQARSPSTPASSAADGLFDPGGCDNKSKKNKKTSKKKKAWA